jgi:hypothetical protein
VAAYLDHRGLAEAENAAEQLFMTIGMYGTASADQFREYYRHLMIVLREYEDFGTYNRRCK